MLRTLLDTVRRALRPSARDPGTPAGPPQAVRPPPGPSERHHGVPHDGVPAPAGRRPAGDYDGAVALDYAPRADGHPDPGEVVWTWVPYEEDARVGKDRPVVVVGRASEAAPGTLAVLMLSSKVHTGDPRWMPLGPGAWDDEGRPSSVRLDRVLAVEPGSVRREGAALDRARFDQVAARLTGGHRP